MGGEKALKLIHAEIFCKTNILTCGRQNVTHHIIKVDWDQQNTADGGDVDDFEALVHPEGPLSNANFLLRSGSNLLKEKWWNIWQKWYQGPNLFK